MAYRHSDDYAAITGVVYLTFGNDDHDCGECGFALSSEERAWHGPEGYACLPCAARADKVVKIGWRMDGRGQWEPVQADLELYYALRQQADAEAEQRA